MKRILILFQLAFFVHANAQNEFAATAFYKEFQKIYADAREGFEECRGSQLKSDFEALQNEFRTKCMLPLADSGKIIIPYEGDPYAIYYFEANKNRLKVDQFGVNLREAVVIAFDKPLFARTETSIINDHPFTVTLYFTEADQDRAKQAIIRQCIYFNNGKYYLSFEIKGKEKDK